MDKALVERFTKIFDGYSGAHGRYRITGSIRERDGKLEGKAQTYKGPVPDEAWEQHLSGKDSGVGVIPLRDDNKTVVFAVIDVDTYTYNLEEWAASLADAPVVLCKSKSGGPHLYFFFAEPMEASLVVEKIEILARRLGVGGSEIFPKQVGRAQDEDQGNWINLPYFGDTRRAIHPDGHELNLEEFLDFVSTKLITQESLEKISGQNYSISDSEQFIDGPPCLQHLHKVGVDTNRNVFLFNVALYYKYRNEDTWADDLQEYNAALPDPLPRDEVARTIIKSVARKAYNYQCKTAPLKDHCDRKTCKNRPCGIGFGEEQKADPGIELANLTIVETFPPVYYVDINKIRTRVESTDDFISQARFKKLAIEVARVVPNKITAAKWDDVIRKLLSTAEVLPAPVDTSPEAMFGHHLKEFLRTNVQVDDIALILAGTAYTSGDGNFTFRPADLWDYLRKQQFRGLTDQIMVDVLRQGYKSERVELEFKGEKVTCTKIHVADIQTEEFTVPTLKQPFEGTEAS